MLKKLSVLFIACFIVTIAATAFANPVWPDVPRDHWAYAAVEKLSQAGLIDGYSDGTFQGNKSLNRFEFAMFVGKAMDKYEKTNSANQALIDRLSAEFASELNKMGARLTKVESKTNIWMKGETRIRYTGDSPGSNSTPKLRGSDSFDFRQRLIFQGNINDKMSWLGRLATQGSNKFGNTDNTAGSQFSIDLMNITMKDTIGFNSIVVGRQSFNAVGAGYLGKPWNADGVTFKKNVGKVEVTGWTGNVKSNTNQNTGTGDSGIANQVTTFRLGTNVNENLKLQTGYFWSDIPGTSTITGTGTLNTDVGSFDKSRGWDISTIYRSKGITVMADYIATTLADATGIPSNPKGFNIEISNKKTPATALYPAFPLTKAEDVGSDAWLIGYRSISAGTIPSGACMSDGFLLAYGGKPYSLTSHSGDNVKALLLSYNRTVAKGLIWAVDYANFNFKDRSLTGLNTSNMNRIISTNLTWYY